jgi:uncharacterized protein YcbK (DUF882 family)/outer membrane murein-binding lipoprotein Lpp
MPGLCLRVSLLAATVLGVHGCVSSPGDQLASINAAPTNKLSSQTGTLQAQTTDTLSDQSAIANQATEDANSLNATTAQGLDNAPLDGASQPAAADADIMVGRKNIAAARGSIFASADNAGMTQNVEQQQQVSLTGIENGQQPGLTLNAAQNSIYAGQIYSNARDTSAIPLPDAQKVSEVQDLALAGMDIPAELQVASADPAMPVDAADPGLAKEALELTPQTRSLDTVQLPQDTAAVAEEPVKSVKKKRTLADFFRGKSQTETASFDDSRFGQQKKRVDPSAIPNMQTAAISDNQLPGVNANAMFPTQNVGDDEHSEDDDEPAGLMKLASLSGMARVAPNGIWTQTDKVEVRCLRPQLVQMLKNVEGHFQRPVVVTSGFRDVGHNRRAGGVRHSLHTLCAAADIQVEGVSKWALADYLRSIPGRGGVGTYCHTDSVHIDVGGERDWNWRCRRKKSRRG